MDNHKDNLITWAEHYIRYDFRLIPLPFRKKSPAMKDWPNRASKIYNEVAEWIRIGYKSEKDGTEILETGGLGIVAGEGSGIIVFDIDGEVGKKTLATLEDKYGKLPNTPTQLTPGGGYHIFFRYFGTCKNHVKILDGLDVRCDGGLVVAAPSIHPNGKEYRWGEGQDLEDLEIAECPTWLRNILGNRKPQEAKPSSVDGIIPEGMRNDNLISKAGSMRYHNFPEAAIELALLETNRTQCQSPLPEKEVREIIKSAMKMKPGKASDNMAVIVPQPEIENLAWGFNHLEVVEPVTFAANLFPIGKISIVASPTGMGKSWLAQRIATDLSNGGNIMDGFADSAPMRTLYFAGEAGRDQMILRGRELGWIPREDNFKIVDAISSEIERISLKLDNPQGQANIRGLIEKTKPDLVIFDSLFSFHTADESSYKEMNPILMFIAKLASEKKFAATALHHIRKVKRFEQKAPSTQDDIIGSSILTRAAAVCFKLEAIDPKNGELLGSSPEKENAVKFSCTKSWYKKPSSMIFQIKDGKMHIDLNATFRSDFDNDILDTIVDAFEEGDTFQTSDVCNLFPKRERSQISRALGRLAKERCVSMSGKGKGTKYKLPTHTNETSEGDSDTAYNV